MYRVEYAYIKGSPSAKAIGTRLQKSLPFEDKEFAEKMAEWLKIMGHLRVRVIEEKK